MKTYSERMAERMAATGLSDSHIVVALLDAGISVTDATVRRWRLGLSQPRAEDIVVIARALGSTPNDMLGFAENDTKRTSLAAGKVAAP